MTAPGPMTGRTVLVTGGSGGIGKETARGLAALGARVAITGRDAVRTGNAAADVRAPGGPPVEAFVGDMSAQSEVRRLSAEMLAALPRIDVLVNNVGGFWNSRHVTADGLERTFALNHLAPFLLTHLLAGRLIGAGRARVVTVSSDAQRLGRIDFADLQGERSWSGQRAYNQSKLANVVFTYELARRLNGTGVTANVLHPGIVRTGLGAEDPGRIQRVMMPFAPLVMKTPERGALTSIHLASSSEVEGVTGRYFANCRPRRSSRCSYDQEDARRLWAVSAGLVGVDPDTGLTGSQPSTS
jgi:NAD(P)-dependent dehydrogenase (short-subunit alcohol dehydrogenase family)